MPVATVNTTASVVLEGNVKRKSVVFTNTHATAKVYLRQGWKAFPTTSDFDFLLGPGIAMEVNLEYDGPMVKEKWQAISDTDNTGLAYIEMLE